MNGRENEFRFCSLKADFDSAHGVEQGGRGGAASH